MNQNNNIYITDKINNREKLKLVNRDIPWYKNISKNNMTLKINNNSKNNSYIIYYYLLLIVLILIILFTLKN